MKTTRPFLTFLFLTLFLLWPIHAAASGFLDRLGTTPTALVLTIDGAITPAMQEYLGRGIQVAEQNGAAVVVLQLNTPGGMLGSMISMAENIRNSHVPVVVYVSPRGAMAASAGTIITLAGHAAAVYS